MTDRDSHRRRLRRGRDVAGAAVVVGLAASVGLLLASDAPDPRAMAASAASQANCTFWPIPSAAY